MNTAESAQSPAPLPGSLVFPRAEGRVQVGVEMEREATFSKQRGLCTSEARAVSPDESREVTRDW